MKKTLLALFLGMSAIALAQEKSQEQEESPISHRHELRIDALEGLIVPAIDVSYEYIISKYSGVGISTYVSLDSDTNNYQKFAITPYYRQYFFSKEDFGAKGFFAEGLLQLGMGDDDEYFYIDDTNNGVTESNWTKFGIGFAVGQKWVSKNGFIVELNLGGGRYFGEDAGPEGFFRGGASIGYRF
ncbi:MAG: DUF3575 domain-containing protein [Bacteroidetes bacterium]|nr:DUF3575 domain-containing protein [Bacteroidota bacterium]